MRHVLAILIQQLFIYFEPSSTGGGAIAVGSPLARDADCCLVYLLMCVLIVGCRDMGLRDIRLVWLNLHLYTLRKFYFLFNTDFLCTTP